MSSSPSIVASFEEVVSRLPELCALRWHDGSWTYAELNARANRLAHFLIGAGVGPEVTVGVFSLRSPETLLAFLAILKAGGAYVSLDPSYPEDRIRYCMEDAGIQLVLADAKEISRVPLTTAKIVPLHESPAENLPATNPELQTNLSSAAHIFYTSGSTGRPKGVIIEHRGVLRLAKNLDYVQIGPGETLLQLTPLNYDVSTFEIWCSWLNGACLALPAAGLTSLHSLGLAFRSFNVSLALLPSSLVPLMLEQEIDSLVGVRQLLVGGDVLAPVHAERFLRKYPNHKLINAYGPTENTVITSVQRVKLEKPMPTRLSIGRPVQKTEVLILDEKLQPVPVGEEGEMILTGEGLARGYCNQPEMTARAFIQVLDPSGRQVRGYRSGDLGRLNPDGTLDFRGRIDDQVKINGMRIELGEIKSILLSHPRVEEAEVLLVESEGKKRLETFAVGRPGAELDKRSLRKYLEEKIPGNWRPSAIRIVPRLPRGPGGKVDRRALLESIPKLSDSEEYDFENESNDPLEKAIWEIWRDVVPGTRIGLHDRFSDLGGDSLSALKMIARVEKMIGRPIGLRALLEGGTIVHIAAAAREAGPVSRPPLMICTQPGTDLPPFFFAHGDYTCGGLYCQKMATKLGSDRPFYSIAPHGTFGEDLPSSFEQAGTHVVQLIRSVQPKGPYHLGGYCNGALAIYEVAQQLLRMGETVATLVLLDPPDLYLFNLRRKITGFGRLVGMSESQGRNIYQRIAEGVEVWQAHGLLRLIADFFNRLSVWMVKKVREVLKFNKRDLTTNLNNHYFEVIAEYEPQRYLASRPVWVILREGESYRRPKQVSYWNGFISDARFEVVPGTHLELQGSMQEIVEVIKVALKASSQVS
jgi:amino acid adenylation domain-containing protein